MLCLMMLIVCQAVETDTEDLQESKLEELENEQK